MWRVAALISFTVCPHFAQVHVVGSDAGWDSVGCAVAQCGSASDKKGIVAELFGAAVWWCRSVISIVSSLRLIGTQ